MTDTRADFESHFQLSQRQSKQEMSRLEIRRKLRLIAKHINELDAALKAQYGERASVFFEADGGIHAMTGDSMEGAAERQSHIIESAGLYVQFGCGAW